MLARLPAGLLVAAAFLLILPHLPVPPFVITLMNNIGLASLVAIGLVLLTGVGGHPSARRHSADSAPTPPPC